MEYKKIDSEETIGNGVLAKPSTKNAQKPVKREYLYFCTKQVLQFSKCFCYKSATIDNELE